jgi:hypothetical protein
MAPLGIALIGGGIFVKEQHLVSRDSTPCYLSPASVLDSERI